MALFPYDVINQFLSNTLHTHAQLAGVGVASKPLQSEKTKVGADTEDLEARLRQLHN